jgi:quinol monooxygenase YgiN
MSRRGTFLAGGLRENEAAETRDAHAQVTDLFLLALWNAGFPLVRKVVEVGPADATEYVSVATFLPVKRWRNVLAFLRMAGAVEAQLAHSEGIVRYGLRTDLPHKRFWTYSVWKDRKAIGSFVGAEPHAQAVKMFAQWAGKGAAFVEWTNADGLVDWEEAERRLKNPTFYYTQ